MQIIRKEINDSHYYYVDGVFYPSVTKILDEAGPKEAGLLMFLKNNTAEDADRIKEATAKRGSSVHKYIENLLNGIEVNIKDEPRDVKDRICRFAEWFDAYKPFDFASEQVVASQKYHFAGTLDMVCKIELDGVVKRVLVDFKNTSGIRFSHKLQLMAYKMAYEEMYPKKKIDACFVLRLGTQHKAGYEFKEVGVVEEKHFLAVYDLYLAMNGGTIPEPPLEKIFPNSLVLNISQKRSK